MIINIILVITTVLHCKSIVCIYNSTHRADHDIIVYLLHDTWLKSSDLSVLTENVSQFSAFDLSAPSKSNEWYIGKPSYDKERAARKGKQ